MPLQCTLSLPDRDCKIITFLSRPCRVFRRNWDVKTSVFDSFSAFFILSNIKDNFPLIKFLSVSFDLLTPTRIYNLYGDTYNYSYRLFYSGDIEYFGREHLPYAIMAITLLCTFCILPLAILALYPFAFFHKFLNLFPVRWYILHTFVDAFQGCYKDGTEQGTRNCRWFAVFYISLRFFCFIVYGYTKSTAYFPLCSVFVLLSALLLVVVQKPLCFSLQDEQHFPHSILYCNVTY